jgi:hypothetical protein
MMLFTMPLSGARRNQLTVGMGLGAVFLGGFVATLVYDGFTAQAGLLLAGAIVFAALGALAWTRFSVSN